MKYLIYIFFFLIIFGSIFLSIKYFTHLKKDIIFKLLSRKLLQIQGYFGQEIFFSSYGLEALIKSNVYNIILNQSTEKAFIYLEQKKYFYEVAILKAFINPCNSVEYFEKAIQKCPKNYLLFAELAKLYLINKQFDYAERIIEKIDIKKANIYTKAVIHYIQSVIATSAGDLLWASKEASSALKLFKKKQAYFEVATTYLHIGTIYRISAVSDVAQCMFEAAKEIFMKMKIDILQAISLANLGMLTAGQNRYEEAEGYFSQALELNQKINNICGKAEILNQQALMETTRENYGEAKKLVSKAKNLHRKIKNDIGDRHMNFIDTLKSVDLVLKTNEVPLVVGESGIGKTALAKKLAQENNWSLVVIDGNLLKEGEIGGLPTIESYTTTNLDGEKIEKR